MTDDGRASHPDAGQLGTLCASWRDVQQTRLALAQRGLLPASEALHKVETALGRAVTKSLRQQPVWPWLSQHPGVRGVHVAQLVSIIGDPHRFPGQPCSLGHIIPARYAVGSQCPVLQQAEGDPVRCDGIVRERRSGTGTRSLWHYLGLHVVNGRAPRKARGQQADWHMQGRSAVQQPGGIAEQIVRLNVAPWVDIYRATKARLAETRAARTDATEIADGPGVAEVHDVIEERGGETRAEVVVSGEIGRTVGLRPFQIDAIARKVAAKAFVGDLLRAMKDALPVDSGPEIAVRRGRERVA